MPERLENALTSLTLCFPPHATLLSQYSQLRFILDIKGLLELLSSVNTLRNAESVGGVLNAGPDQGRWNDEPEEVHHEVVHPEVKELWSGVDDALVVVVKHGGGVVEDDTIELAGGDDDLDWVAEWMSCGDHAGDNEAQWSPSKLAVRSV